MFLCDNQVCPVLITKLQTYNYIETLLVKYIDILDKNKIYRLIGNKQVQDKQVHMKGHGKNNTID